MKNSNIFILSGGGGNAAVSVGAVRYLFDQNHFNNTPYDYIMGGSVGANIAAYISTGQFSDLYDLWQKKIPNINPIPFPYIRSYTPDSFLDFMRKGDFALDTKKLRNSIPVIVAVMNRRTKLIEHFEINKSKHVFDLLYASCSVPVLTKKYISIKGDSYCDSILVSHPYGNTMYALKNFNPKKITVMSCMSEKGFELDRDNDRNILAIERRFLGIKSNGIGTIPDLAEIDYQFYGVKPIIGSRFTSVKNCAVNLAHGYQLMKSLFTKNI